MKFDKLAKAEKEAKRFLESIKKLRERTKENKYFVRHGYITGCAETGAVKRASMDLTRALADLRGRNKR